jgi:hypothetical protein
MQFRRQQQQEREHKPYTAPAALCFPARRALLSLIEKLNPSAFKQRTGALQALRRFIYDARNAVHLSTLLM